MTPEEIKIIVGSFNPTGGDTEIKEVQSKGFSVGAEKYIALRSDDSRLYGKKV